MSVELIEGDQASFNGPVRVTVNGLTGRVCANNWTDAAANVVCRQLGSTGGKAYQLHSLVRTAKVFPQNETFIYSKTNHEKSTNIFVAWVFTLSTLFIRTFRRNKIMFVRCSRILHCSRRKTALRSWSGRWTARTERSGWSSATSRGRERM